MTDSTGYNSRLVAIVACAAAGGSAVILAGLLGASLTFGADVARAEEGGKLTIRVTGLEEFKGDVLLSVANSREMFESDDEAFRGARVPASGKEVSKTFEGLVAGDYAVKMFHDTNGNKKFDIGMLGPKEKYGFSNNVMGFMGPPDFDDAKFKFDGGDLTIDIKAK